MMVKRPFEVIVVSGVLYEVRDGKNDVFARRDERGKACVIVGLLESASDSCTHDKAEESINRNARWQESTRHH